MFARSISWISRYRAEILVSLAVTAAWSFLTWGIASLLVWEVWPLSAGLFLLSLAGWRFVWTIARDGLYALTREDRRG